MDTREKIEVMQAYIDGKTIQCKDKMINDDEWDDIVGNGEVSWDWSNKDFRIKPEEKIRPYKDAKEFIQAQKEHGPYINRGKFYSLVTEISNDGVVIGVWVYSFLELLSATWQDGTPCGIAVEE